MALTTSNDSRRGFIAKELLSTERTYVKKHLKPIVDVFLIPLRREVEKPIIKPRNVQIIFSNVEEVLMVNAKFLETLEKRIEVWTEQPHIGDIFLEILPEFAAYDIYLMDHHKAILHVSELAAKGPFATFLQAAKEVPETGGLELLALLITPVQRILRYKLLLEDMLKCTDKDHPDYEPTSQALETILQKAAAVNASIKKAENYEKMCQIQKSFITGNVKNLVTEDRLFVREGQLTKVCRKLPKKRWFFLFNDILIYASVITQASGGNLYAFHRMMQTSKTRVKPIVDSESQRNAFQVLNNDKSFIVMADSSTDRELWLMDLNECTTGNRLPDDQVITTSGRLSDSAPVWIPDNEAEMCMICTSPFTFVKRRHHCRKCGKVVCGPCSASKVSIASIDDGKIVRVCDFCSPTTSGKAPDALISANEDVDKKSPNSATSTPTLESIRTANIGKQHILSQIMRESIMMQGPPVFDEQGRVVQAPSHGTLGRSKSITANMLPLSPVSPRATQNAVSPRNSAAMQTTPPNPPNRPPVPNLAMIKQMTTSMKHISPPPRSASVSGMTAEHNHVHQPPLRVADRAASLSSLQLNRVAVPRPVQIPGSVPPKRPPQRPSVNLDNRLSSSTDGVHSPTEDRVPPPLPPRSKSVSQSLIMSHMSQSARNLHENGSSPTAPARENVVGPMTQRIGNLTREIENLGEQLGAERAEKSQLEIEVRMLNKFLYKLLHCEASHMDQLPLVECVRELSKKMQEYCLNESVSARKELSTSGSGIGRRANKESSFLIMPPARPPPQAPGDPK